MKEKSKVIQNTFMLYIMTFARYVFPLMMLPYLTRVLSVENYGVTTYVKSIMLYLQVFVDFGFILSSTKSIVNANGNMKKIGEIVSNTIMSKLILSIIGLLILLILSSFISVLAANFLYVLLYYLVVILSSFLMDYLFRGLEKIHILTIRFVIVKAISMFLTFIFVKSDNQLLLIPLFDVLSSFIACILSYIEAKKIGVKFYFAKVKEVIKCLKESSIYFLSSMASVAFNMLNTVLIGMYANSIEIAYWGVIMQILSAIQALYTPIIDGIYPEMVKNKNFNLVKKIMKIFIPLIIIGTIFVISFSKQILLIICGEKYIGASKLLIFISPIFILSFLAMLFGWTSLGAIDKQKEITISTVISAIFQFLGLMLLVYTKNFVIIYVAILRCITELIMFLMRILFLRKFKSEFNAEKFKL